MDYYDKKIEAEDTPKIQEKGRKALKSVKDKIRRSYTFSDLTIMVRKLKNSLLKLYVIDSRIKETKTYYSRKEIESILIQYNRFHLSKAKNTLVYRENTKKILYKMRSKISS